MAERVGYLPDAEEAGRHVVREVETALGLDSADYPSWRYTASDEQIFPEEAPTRAQREFANYCLTDLYVAVDHHRRHQRPAGEGEQSPLAAQSIQQAYHQSRRP